MKYVFMALLIRIYFGAGCNDRLLSGRNAAKHALLASSAYNSRMTADQAHIDSTSSSWAPKVAKSSWIQVSCFKLN